MKLFFAVVLILAVCVLFVGCLANIYNMPEIKSYESYVVQPGDTLWGIAHQSNGWNRIDGQMIIKDIRDRSNCTSTIYPGQVVYIPMYE